MKTKFIGRHGDVAIFKVIDEIEKTENDKKTYKEVGMITLAEGETTGHHHEVKTMSSKTGSKCSISVLTDEEVDDTVLNGVNIKSFNANNNDEVMFRILGGSAALTHQEHQPILLEEGVYIKRIQTEFDPFEKKLRKVRD